MKKHGYQAWLSGWAFAFALNSFVDKAWLAGWLNLVLGVAWLVAYHYDTVTPCIGDALWNVWRPIAWKVYGTMRDYRFGRWIYTKDTDELNRYQRWAYKALPYSPEYKEEKVHE